MTTSGFRQAHCWFFARQAVSVIRGIEPVTRPLTFWAIDAVASGGTCCRFAAARQGDTRTPRRTFDRLRSYYSDAPPFSPSFCAMNPPSFQWVTCVAGLLMGWMTPAPWHRCAKLWSSGKTPPMRGAVHAIKSSTRRQSRRLPPAARYHHNASLSRTTFSTLPAPRAAACLPASPCPPRSADIRPRGRAPYRSPRRSP